jgi:hypothetical protein
MQHTPTHLFDTRHLNLKMLAQIREPALWSEIIDIITENLGSSVEDPR